VVGWMVATRSRRRGLLELGKGMKVMETLGRVTVMRVRAVLMMMMVVVVVVAAMMVGTTGTTMRRLQGTVATATTAPGPAPLDTSTLRAGVSTAMQQGTHWVWPVQGVPGVGSINPADGEEEAVVEEEEEGRTAVPSLALEQDLEVQLPVVDQDPRVGVGVGSEGAAAPALPPWHPWPLQRGSLWCLGGPPHGAGWMTRHRWRSGTPKAPSSPWPPPLSLLVACGCALHPPPEDGARRMEARG
jgi:hypothetical protein